MRAGRGPSSSLLNICLPIRNKRNKRKNSGCDFGTYFVSFVYFVLPEGAVVISGRGWKATIKHEHEGRRPGWSYEPVVFFDENGEPWIDLGNGGTAGVRTWSGSSGSRRWWYPVGIIPAGVERPVAHRGRGLPPTRRGLDPLQRRHLGRAGLRRRRPAGHRGQRHRLARQPRRLRARRRMAGAGGGGGAVRLRCPYCGVDVPDPEQPSATASPPSGARRGREIARPRPGNGAGGRGGAP